MNGDQLLTRVDANLQGLLKNFDELKKDTKEDRKENAKEHKELRECITGTTSKYLEKKLFWKIIGLMSSGGVIAVLFKIFI
jgi:hypothetical protein